MVRDRPPRLIAEAAREAFEAIVDEPPELGEPERVRSIDGGEGYWLVPGLREGRVVAVARILPDGRPATVGELRAPAADAAQAVTGLSAAEARDVAAGLRSGNADVADPVLVHDGPVGREAWLCVVASTDGTRRWVFATGGGTYERPADSPL